MRELILNVPQEESSTQTAVRLRTLDLVGTAPQPTPEPVVDKPPPGIYQEEPKYSLAEKALKAIGIPIAREEGISEAAKAKALVEYMAGQEGVPISEYREAPGPMEQVAEGFVSGASGGIYPAVRRAVTGEEAFSPTTTAEKITRGVGELGGFVFGPAKFAESIIGRAIPGLAKVAPKVADKKKIRLLKAMAREAAVLAPATGISQTGEAISKQTWGEATTELAKGTLSGAVTGAIFGASRGLFPKTVEDRAKRIIAGLIGLNARRAVMGQGFPTDMPLEDVVFDTAMDVFFLWGGLGSEGLKKAENAIKKGKLPSFSEKQQQRIAEAWNQHLKEYGKSRAKEILRKRAEKKAFERTPEWRQQQIEKEFAGEERKPPTKEEIAAARQRYGLRGAETERPYPYERLREAVVPVERAGIVPVKDMGYGEKIPEAEIAPAGLLEAPKDIGEGFVLRPKTILKKDVYQEKAPFRAITETKEPIIEYKDIRPKSGKPYKTKGAAMMALRTRKDIPEGYSPVKVFGGWVLRKPSVIPERLQVEPKAPEERAVQEEALEVVEAAPEKPEAVVPAKEAPSPEKPEPTSEIKTAASRMREAGGEDFPLNVPPESKELDEYEKAYKNEAKEVIEEYKNRVGSDRVIVLTDKEGKRGAIIAPSTKEGNFQATYWDKRGFSNDTQHDTKEEAVKEVFNSFQYPNPEAFKRISKEPEFVDGILAAEKAQKEHMKRMAETAKKPSKEPTLKTAAEKNYREVLDLIKKGNNRFADDLVSYGRLADKPDKEMAADLLRAGIPVEDVDGSLGKPISRRIIEEHKGEKWADDALEKLEGTEGKPTPAEKQQQAGPSPKEKAKPTQPPPAEQQEEARPGLQEPKPTETPKEKKAGREKPKQPAPKQTWDVKGSKKAFQMVIARAVEKAPKPTGEDVEAEFSKPYSYSGTRAIDVRGGDRRLKLERDRYNKTWAVYDEGGKRLIGGLALKEAKSFAQAEIRGEAKPDGFVVFRGPNNSFEYKIPSSRWHLREFARRIAKTRGVRFESKAGVAAPAAVDESAKAKKGLADTLKRIIKEEKGAIDIKPLVNKVKAVRVAEKGEPYQEIEEAAKKGDTDKTRRAIRKLHEDFLTPIEGSALDKAAVAYLKSEKLSDYLAAMPNLGEISPKELFRYDPKAKKHIAQYLTRDGNLKPALRKSGFFAIKRFDDAIKNYKDISKTLAATSDPVRMMQAIDQGRWGGVVQRYIGWPTHMTELAKLRWADIQKARLASIVDKYEIRSKKKRNAVGDIIEHVSGNDAWNWKVEKILNIPAVKLYLSQFKIGDQIKIVKAAMEFRRMFQNLLDNQNAARKPRKQRIIPYRAFYRPWIMEANLWSRVFGLKVRPKEIMERAEAPDFIFPNRPWNPRAEARSGLLEKYEKERDIVSLMSGYIETAARDIFDTNIVHNNKIYSAVLRGRGLEHAANGIDSWTAESFAGVKPRLSRFFAETVPVPVRAGLKKLRSGVTKAAFPLNWPWNLFVQTSSAGLTYTRYGEAPTLAGLQYFYNMPMRQAIKQNAYSLILKSRWGGKAAYQDLQNSILRNKRLDTKPIEKIEDYANFLTSAVEDALTGHAVSAAYHYGKNKLGLKGRELWQFASEGGAKTQSMYNYSGLPGVLRNRETGQIFWFSTFSFDVFNTLREMNLPVLRKVIGRTGLYETMTADSVGGKALLSNRLKMLARWAAAIIVTNAVAEKVIGRKPWMPSSFLPLLGSYLFGGYSGLGRPLGPKQYIDDLRIGIRHLIKYGNFKKLRKWLVRYHVLGGVQLNRTIGGIEAVAKGEVRDVRGRRLYRVKGTGEQVKAITMGPSKTEAARKHYEKKNKNKGILGAIVSGRRRTGNRGIAQMTR